MQRLSIAALLLTSMLSKLPAYGAPSIFISVTYDRRAAVFVLNDVPGSIIKIKSSLGTLKVPTYPDGPIPAPGVIDDSDLPFDLTFSDLPVGAFKLGSDMLNLRAYPSKSWLSRDITMDWRPGIDQPAVVGEVAMNLDGPDFPEPSSGLMAALGAIGFVGGRRRLARELQSDR